MAHLPSLGLFHIFPLQMSVWQPYFNIQKYDTDFFHETNKTDAYH